MEKGLLPPSSSSHAILDEQEAFKLHRFSVHEIRNLQEAIVLNSPIRSEFFYVFIVKAGEIYFKLNRKEYHVKAGELCVIPPSALIEVSTILSKCEATGIIFCPDFFLGLGLHYSYPQILEIFAPESSLITAIGEEELATLDWLLKRLKQLNRPKCGHLFETEILTSTFSQFIYELGNIYHQHKIGRQLKLRRKENLVLLFFKEVSKYYKKERGVQFYANLLFITRKYLSKTVKQVTGKTPGFFIDEAVIREAKILLADPKLSINEIAQSLNFADQSTFGKFFKKQVGLAPTAFRI
ncbi:helix-turn-helix transcriptional regulator [Olivibacter sp. CPCC 100613]|uniref:AraC family transcriptional regulator n=1 Tax=Olivibacter sp. CPCC 100613 TaxID=3079931 RepID=UPI002FF8F74B